MQLFPPSRVFFVYVFRFGPESLRFRFAVL